MPRRRRSWRTAAAAASRACASSPRWRLSRKLFPPAGRDFLNVCVDRYRFTVGLAACLITERVSLLPSTHTPEVIRQLKAFAPDAFCLTDDSRCEIDLP